MADAVTVRIERFVVLPGHGPLMPGCLITTTPAQAQTLALTGKGVCLFPASGSTFTVAAALCASRDPAVA